MILGADVFPSNWKYYICLITFTISMIVLIKNSIKNNNSKNYFSIEILGTSLKNTSHELY